MKSKCATIQMKATKQLFHGVLFVFQNFSYCKLGLCFFFSFFSSRPPGRQKSCVRSVDKYFLKRLSHHNHFKYKTLQEIYTTCRRFLSLHPTKQTVKITCGGITAECQVDKSVLLFGTRAVIKKGS